MNNEKFSVELELVTNKFTNRMDNLKNKITSFADKVKDKSKIALNIDPKIDAQLDMYKNKLINLIKDFDSNIDIDIDKDGNLNVAEKDVEKLRNAFSKMAPEAKGEINQLIKIIKKLTNSVNGKETSKIKQFFNAFKNGSKEGSDNLKNGLSKSFDSGISRIKKFTLSLFGIRSIYSLLSRASSAYMSQDTANANKIQAAWIGLGSIFAPLIEKIANFAIKAVSYVNVFVKALTGVDLLARAATKSIDKMSKAGKSASRNLSGLDEITNIGGSSSGLAGGIANDWSKAFDDVELNPTVVNFIENLADKLKFVWEKLEPSLSNIWNNILLPAGQWIIEKPGRLASIVGIIMSYKIGSKIAAFLPLLTSTGAELGIMVGLKGGLVGVAVALGAIAAVQLGQIISEAESLNEEIDRLIQNTKTGNDKFKDLTDSMMDNARAGKLSDDEMNRMINTMFNVIDANESINDNIKNQSTLTQILTGTLKENTEILNLNNESTTDCIAKLSELYYAGKLDKEQIERYSKALLIEMNILEEQNNTLSKTSDKYKMNEQMVKALRTEYEKITKSTYVAELDVKADTSKAKSTLKTFFSKLGDSALSVLGLKGLTQKIASLDVGTNYVPNDQMALIHKGEAVIPKKFNSTEYFSQNNEKVESLLEELIDRVDRIDFNPYIGVEDIGRASVKYINTENRKQGRSVI